MELTTILYPPEVVAGTFELCRVVDVDPAIAIHDDEACERIGEAARELDEGDACASRRFRDWPAAEYRPAFVRLKIGISRFRTARIIRRTLQWKYGRPTYE